LQYNHYKNNKLYLISNKRKISKNEILQMCIILFKKIYRSKI